MRMSERPEYHMTKALLKNSFHTDFTSDDLQLQTIQILRWLEKFEKKGWAAKLEPHSKPVYQLTTFGLIELLQSFADSDKQMPVSEAIFIQSYLSTYEQIIRDTINSLGDITIEQEKVLNRILGKSYVLRQQVAILDRLIRDLQYRIDESSKLIKFIDGQQDKDINQVLASIPSEFSYQLSYRKPFKEWLQEMPPKLAKLEFEQGFQDRQKNFYRPYLEFLQQHRSYYASLVERTD